MMQGNAEKHKDSVRLEKLELLDRQSLPATFVSLFNAVIVVVILWSEYEHAYLSAWLGLLLFASLFRFYWFYRFRLATNKVETISVWERSYLYSLFFSSSIWGLGGLLLVMNSSIFYQAVIYYFLIGMSGGAVCVYSAIRKMVLSTISVILLPVTIYLLFSGETALFLMSITGSVFFLAAVTSTKVLSNALNDSFSLAYELNDAKEKAEELSRIDSLTGLYNHRYFSELLELQNQYCQRKGESMSFILLDIDNFKEINDSHGHFIGDQVLKSFSKLLSETIRKSDVCGRLGGEEFGIFLPGTKIDEAALVAEKIKKTFESVKIKAETETFSVSASFGVAAITDDIEDALKNADKAMYQSKTSGRNKVTISQE